MNTTDELAIERRGAPAEQPGPKQYTRKASGLIRSVSAWDVFGICSGNSLVGLGIAFILVYVPWLYVGANVYLSVLIAAVAVVPLILIYLRLSVIYPRSGGEYVYGSRVLHPSIGFAANVCFVVGMCFFIGLGGAYTVGYALGPMFEVAGVQLGKSWMVSTGTWLIGHNGIFLVSVLLIMAFATVVTVFGPRTYYRIQGIMVILGVITLVFIGIYGLVASRSGAFAHLNTLFGALGMGSASKLSAGSLPSFSLGQTFNSIMWPATFLVSAYYSVYVGGEVKSPQRNQMIGGLGALGYLAAIPLLVMAGMAVLFGLPFFANLSSAMAQSTFGVAAAPSFAALVAGAIGNGYVTILLLLGFATFPLIMVGAIMLLVSRCIFAWSVDRVVPASVSKVSARSHQPYVATWIAAAASVVFAFLVAYGYLTAMGANWAFFVAEMTALVAAVVLPYRQKALWKASPGKWRLFGIPDLVVLAILGAPLFAFLIWRNLVDLNLGVTPSHNFPQFISSFAIFAVAVVSYFIVKGVRARQGLDLSRNYREIPPE